ncbi:MAG: hypothetical protein COA57_02255 [Flavobacteriales bacterium]|nr:MAG: hypothetical protein COA57_02255 [Flavobacteriales bacterium]
MFLCVGSCFNPYENQEGYYESGSFYFYTGKKGEGQLLNGKKNGNWIFYDETRKIISKGTFENDLLHGRWTFFHPNNQKTSEGNFIHDFQDGKWLFWNENGELYRETVFERGKAVSTVDY